MGRSQDIPKRYLFIHRFGLLCKSGLNGFWMRPLTSGTLLNSESLGRVDIAKRLQRESE